MNMIKLMIALNTDFFFIMLPGCKPEEKQESDSDARFYFQEIMTRFS